MYRYLLGLFLACLFIISCKEENKQSKKIRPLSFSKERIIKKSGANCDTAEYDCSIISLEVLKANGAASVSKQINAALEEHVIKMIASQEDTLIGSLEELSENFLKDHQEAAESFSEEPPWEAYVNEAIYLKNDYLISIGITTEIFSGGAHGYKSLSFINIDPRTGNIYNTEDLFTPEFQELVEEKFRLQQNIPEDVNINDTGFWFKNDKFHLPENVGFSEEKVILIYNSYEIAPYAAGEIYLEIPMEEARPFLKIG
jgi:hypothetical protein